MKEVKIINSILYSCGSICTALSCILLLNLFRDSYDSAFEEDSLVEKINTLNLSSLLTKSVPPDRTKAEVDRWGRSLVPPEVRVHRNSPRGCPYVLNEVMGIKTSSGEWDMDPPPVAIITDGGGTQGNYIVGEKVGAEASLLKFIGFESNGVDYVIVRYNGKDVKLIKKMEEVSDASASADKSFNMPSNVPDGKTQTYHLVKSDIDNYLKNINNIYFQGKYQAESDGVLITDLESTALARKFGVLPGDKIKKIDGKSVSSANVVDMLGNITTFGQKIRTGQLIKVTLERNGKPFTLSFGQKQPRKKKQ